MQDWDLPAKSPPRQTAFEADLYDSSSPQKCLGWDCPNPLTRLCHALKDYSGRVTDFSDSSEDCPASPALPPVSTEEVDLPVCEPLPPETLRPAKRPRNASSKTTPRPRKLQKAVPVSQYDGFAIYPKKSAVFTLFEDSPVSFSQVAVSPQVAQTRYLLPALSTLQLVNAVGGVMTGVVLVCPRNYAVSMKVNGVEGVPLHQADSFSVSAGATLDLQTHTEQAEVLILTVASS